MEEGSDRVSVDYERIDWCQNGRVDNIAVENSKNWWRYVRSRTKIFDEVFGDLKKTECTL